MLLRQTSLLQQFNRDPPVPASDIANGDMQQTASNTAPGETIQSTPVKKPILLDAAARVVASVTALHAQP